MSEQFVYLKDIHGCNVTVDVAEIMELITEQHFRLFGMDLHTIIELRSMYFIRGGNEPITVDSVRAVMKTL